MNIVGYGGGTNSTAMLVGMHQRNIPVDLILFSDTGGEQAHTYAYLPIMNQWLSAHGMPEITVVEYTDQYGGRLTLEQECLRSGTLPAIAYGYKKCSLKHKIAPQDKFCNHYEPCLEVWEQGEKVTKYIGFDAGEEHRKTHAFVYDIQDKKYKKEYPLIDWGWYREDCVAAILQEDLPLPGKSSCFFCPSISTVICMTEPSPLNVAQSLTSSLYRGLGAIGLGKISWRQTRTRPPCVSCSPKMICPADATMASKILKEGEKTWQIPQPLRLLQKPPLPHSRMNESEKPSAGSLPPSCRRSF
jgi:hypothetical protein